MAPPLQAIILAASFMLLIVSCSAQLAEPPSPSTTAVASAPLKLSGVLYTIEYRIGDSIISGIMDTGSDLIWTKTCQVFESLVSCPFHEGKEMGISCCNNHIPTFEREYGNTASVGGIMAKAKLTLTLDQSSYTTRTALNIGSAIMSKCHLPSVDGKESQACRPYESGGIVGLGRGKLSLVKQLELRSFSYCLPDHTSAAQVTGRINFNFNDGAAPLKGAQRTKLVTIDKEYPASSRYYVKLEKIVIGATKKEVKLRNGCLNMESNLPGMIIDSGSAFTSLPDEAFNAVKEHVDLVMNKRKTGVEPVETPGENDFSCYLGTHYPDGLGSIFLQFCNEARMEIPAENYLFPEKGERLCLAMKPQAGGKSILGVYQQRGLHMLFDIQDNTLSFAKSSGCGGQSQEENHATL